MGDDFISGLGSPINDKLNSVIKDLASTNKIVIEIFRKLEEFKAAVNDDLKKAALKNIQENLERLKNLVENAGGALGKALDLVVDKIQGGLDSVRISGISPSDSKMLAQAQKQIDELKDQLTS